MRAPREVRFEPLLDIPGTVEVIGYGRLRPGTGQAVEAKIQVLLARRGPGIHFTPRSDTFVREVGCGIIAMLKARSRVTNGSLEADRPSQLIWTADVSPSRRGRTTLGGPGEYDGMAPWSFLPTDEIADAPQFDLDCSDVAHQFTAGASGTGKTPHPPRSIVVPQVEVISYLFGVSSRLLLPLFDGVRDGAVAGDRGLFDFDKSSVLPDGTVQLICHRAPTREEAIVGALIFTDKQIRRAYFSVFQSLSVQPDWIATRGAHIAMTFPFEGRTRWKFEGRWIGRDQPESRERKVIKRFIVTRILDIDFEPGFRLLDVIHPLETTTRGSEGLPPGAGGRAGSKRRRSTYVVDKVPSRSRPRDEERLDGVGEAISEIITVSFRADNTLVVPPRRLLRDGEERETQSSTAGREDGGDPSVTGTDVRRPSKRPHDSDAPHVEPGLDAARLRTLTAIRIAARGDWSIRILGGEGIDAGDEAGVARAVTACGGSLLVEVRVSGKCLVLADRGSDKVNPRSLGVLLSLGSSAIDEGDLELIAERAAKIDGRWAGGKASIDGFAISAIYRPPVANTDADKYAKLIRRKVDEALAPLTMPPSSGVSDASEA